jgi:hypothetical protein
MLDYIGIFCSLTSKFSIETQTTSIDSAGINLDKSKKLYSRGLTLIELSYFFRILLEGIKCRCLI